MKHVWLMFFVFFATDVFCELTIVQTTFRKAPLEVVSQLAEQENPEAQLELALRYYAGHQVPEDASKAFLWMRKSAGQSHPAALELLSQMCAEGIGVPADAPQAEAWFVAALAESPNDPRLKKQFEQRVNEKKESGGSADEFLKKCADAGYTPAYVLAYSPQATSLFLNGQYEEALPLLKKLSAAGDAESTARLAKMYAEGFGGLPQDVDEAFVLYQTAAACGNGPALDALATMHARKVGPTVDSKQMQSLYEQAAKGGAAEAQYRLAESEFSAALVAENLSIYDSSQKYKNDYVRRLKSAVRWYTAAAEQLYPAAQYMMGRLCASGEGVPRNFEKAVQYYQAAVTQGHASSMFYLGLMYHAGLGVSQDVAKAVSLYKEAAALGDKGALFYLGNCYRFGIGVPQSLVVGESYYLKRVLVDAKTPTDEMIEGQGAPWILKSAREYGVILSSKDFKQAESWIAWAAKHGAQGARDSLCQMVKKRLNSDAVEIVLQERKSDPAVDAVEKQRNVDAFHAYFLEDVDELYGRKLNFRRVISRVVRPHKKQKDDLSDDRSWGLLVEFAPPAPGEIVDVNGVLLMGVEFEDKDTGEKYWALDSVKDREIAFRNVAVTVSLSMNVPARKVRVADWFVLYGNLPDESPVLAVWESELKDVSLKDVERLFLRGRSLNRLDAAMQLTAGTREDVDNLIKFDDGSAVSPEEPPSLNSKK